MNIKNLIVTLVFVSPSALAGDAENIKACVDEAKSAGVSVDPFQVIYKSSFFKPSVAEWANARCEVSSMNVENLIINGKEIIYQGFRGRAAFDLNQRLEREIDAAVNALYTRAQLIAAMKESSTKRLKSTNVDLTVVKRDVKSYVERALSTPPDRPL